MVNRGFKIYFRLPDFLALAADFFFLDFSKTVISAFLREGIASVVNTGGV